MESQTLETNKRSINNAISAYFMILVSGAFLLNKTDKYVNNAFVKSHTKVALVTHICFILVYVIFSSFSLFRWISILSFQLNYIIATALFFILFTFLLYWIYKASKWESFSIWEIQSLWNRSKIVDVNGDNKLDEKDIFTLILCYVPFVGYMVHGRYFKNKTVKNIVHINMLSTGIITLLYIFNYSNVALILLLLYIVFWVFCCINIIHSWTILHINTYLFPTPEKKILITRSFIKYVKNYISKSPFENFSDIYTHNRNQYIEEEKANIIATTKLKKAPSFFHIITYIPLLNLINFSQLHTQLRYHAINWLSITLISLLVIAWNYFSVIPERTFVLLLFPIFFGYWFLQSRPAYKMPYIYDLYEILAWIKNLFVSTKKTIKAKKEEVHEENHTISWIPDPNKK